MLLKPRRGANKEAILNFRFISVKWTCNSGFVGETTAKRARIIAESHQWTARLTTLQRHKAATQHWHMLMPTLFHRPVIIGG